MTFDEYLAALRRHWAFLLVLTVLGGAASFGFASTITPLYRSTTSVLLVSDVGGTGTDLVQGSTYVQNLVASYVRLATSERVLQPVIDDLELDTTVNALARDVTAESPRDTVIIDIAVVGSRPQEVAAVADAVTGSLADAVETVSPRGAGGDPVIRLTLTQSASIPFVPVSPDKTRRAALGMLAGLALGVAVVVVRRLRGTTILAPDDIARVTTTPVVGEIAEAPRGTTLPAAVLNNDLGIEAESLRGLTANLAFLGVGRGLASLVVTSASPGESKSSVAASAGLVLAEGSFRVLLIDADLRAPSIHILAQLDNSIGLSTVLIGDQTLDEAVQPWGPGGLDVLVSGPAAPNPAQLLSSDAMRQLLAGAESAYDFVIIDSAPLLSVADASFIGQMAHGALVVARRGKTTTRSLSAAMDNLASSGVAVSGIVISRASRRARAKYAYSATATARPARRRA